MLTNRIKTLTLVAALGLLAACTDKTDPAATATTGSPTTEATAVYTPLIIDSTRLQTVTPGLQLFIAKEGQGKQVAVGDEVIVHYHGRLPDGRVFDSSYQKGSPFNVQNIGQAQVIRGWNIALPLLKVGAKAVVVIAPELGYGNQAVGPIPPNSTLVFDIEVLDSHPMAR